MRPRSSFASVSAYRQTAALLAEYAVSLRPGKVRGAAAGDHDSPARRARASIGMTARQLRMHAEHVDLEDLPPLLDRDAPRSSLVIRFLRSRRAGRSARARVRPSRPSARRRRRWTRRPRARARRSRRDSFDLLAGAPGHGDAHACIRELARDRGADPTPAARDERDAVEAVRRHERSLPAPRGSRASTSPRDLARAHARAPRGGRSSRSASWAAPRRR